MKIILCNSEIYAECVMSYINSLDIYERQSHNLNDYLRSAKYNIVPNCNYPEFDQLKITVSFVVNSGVQYDLPHTMGYVIVIPQSMIDKDLREICFHEALHVYMRYNCVSAIRTAMIKHDIVYTNRKRFSQEITNPDTTGKIALKYGNTLISPVIITPFVIRYVTYENGNWRSSNDVEIKYYQKKLPFPQNYHVEEILIFEIIKIIYHI